MRKTVSILAAILFAGFSSHASGPASEALPFVQQDFNPVSLSMGSTGVGSAALVPFGGFKASGGVGYTSYMPKLAATRYINAGAAGNIGKIGMALSFARGEGEEISGTNFTPFNILVDAGVGYRITDGLAAGVNLKFAKDQLLSDYYNSAFAADIFLAGKAGQFDYSAGVSNIGGKVSSESTGDFSLPQAATVAGGYSFEEIIHSLRARVKADYYFSGNFGASFGAEYGFADIVFVRGGYHYGGDTVIPSFASAGIGVSFSEFSLDAACLFASESLQDSFSVSLRVTF